MSQERLDYDLIAPEYNRRFESGGQPATANVLHELVGETRAEQVLEVGCGTGHWLGELTSTGAWLCGLDFSSGMLAQAREGDALLPLVQGRAEELAYENGSFDLVLCVNALHHFQRKPDFVAEAFRLLRQGGALAVIGMQPQIRRQDWYVYDYFEGVYEADVQRFPSWGKVLDWMTAAGFQRSELQPVETIVDHKYGAEVLSDPFLEKNATSQLALLSQQAYQSGLNRIRKDLEAAKQAGVKLIFRVVIQIEMLVGWK